MLLPRSAALPTALVGTLLASATWGAPGTAVGTSPAASTGPAVVLPHAGYPGLVVGFDGEGELRAAVCTNAPCSLVGGTVLSLPPETGKNQRSASLSVVPIGHERRVVVVNIPSSRPHNAWQAVVAAVAGKALPEILFQGPTGYVTGEDGLRRGPMLQVSEVAEPDGSRRIVSGEVREDLTLCGRPAVLMPKVLVAPTFEWKPAKVQRLGVAERAEAPRLVAERLPMADSATSTATPLGSPETTATDTTRISSPPASVLKAVAASSAVGSPGALSDGDPETTWAENRGGSGRGEFVILRMPSDLPLRGMRLRIRPEKRVIPNGVGPRVLWLATTDRVFQVSFAEDPWNYPGAEYRVVLPEPVQTGCVAWVTDSAFKEGPDVEVTISEVVAESEFSSASPETLVAALAGGEARAEAAGSTLGALGEPGFRAVKGAFGGLDEDGRRVALNVLDHAPCELSAQAYVTALLSPSEAQQNHARRRLAVCGPKGADALVAGLERPGKDGLLRIAEVLAELAPDRALRVLFPQLSVKSAHRPKLRQILTAAAADTRSNVALTELLGQHSRPLTDRITLLRLLGNRVTAHATAAAPTILEAMNPATPWQLRYLAVAPGQQLAPGDPSVRDVMGRALLTDPNPYVRTEIAHAMTSALLYKTELGKALADDEVRVREAAAEALSSPQGSFAFSGLTEILKNDDWPLVRVAAARALGAQGAGSPGESLLIETMNDPSWLVRVAAIQALGERRAQTAGHTMLELLGDKDERIEVQLAAVQALGNVCYAKAADRLSELSNRLTNPLLEPGERSLATSALMALGRLHPPDLNKRLARLAGMKNPSDSVKDAVRAALGSRPACEAK